MYGEGGVPARPVCMLTLDAASEQRLGRKVPKEKRLAGQWWPSPCPGRWHSRNNLSLLTTATCHIEYTDCAQNLLASLCGRDHCRWNNLEASARGQAGAGEEAGGMELRR